MTDSINIGKKLRAFVFDNIVTIIFVIFVILGLSVATDLAFSFFVNDLLSRFFRNGFLVLSLIIPVMAGLGLNFGIVVGALAGMLAIIAVRFMGVGGVPGLLLCALFALPLAMFFGFLTGKLYNKTRGQEMIASLIVGFFATGIYQFITLFGIGGIIPTDPLNPMVMPDGVGLNATFDMGMHPSSPIYNPETMTPGLAQVLDRLWMAPFVPVLIVVAVCMLVFLIIKQRRSKKNPALRQTKKWVFILYCAICVFFVLVGVHDLVIPAGGIIFIMPGFIQAMGVRGILVPGSPLAGVRDIPAITGVVIVVLCLFTHYFTKTKLGQDCRSVGQSQHIAKVSGINVDRTRIIATMFSTVLASWGMIIFLQNMGTVSTYSAHVQIGMFSVASLLVGGASMSKASVKNALIGVILFNAMFIVSPAIGGLISNDVGVGEYTRSFMVYGVIGLALGLYIWKANKIAKSQEVLGDKPADDAAQKTQSMIGSAGSGQNQTDSGQSDL